MNRIEHVHPPYWFAGMKWSRLQILLHGKDVGKHEVCIEGDGIRLAEVIHKENGNYLILYVDIADAPAQTFSITLRSQGGGDCMTIPYELREREFCSIETFDAHDVLYLLMPDRWADGNIDNYDEKRRRYEGMRDKAWNKDYVHPAYGDFTRHGGDLAGMTQHLDYFVNLGVTTIWPTPMVENDNGLYSYHGYNATDLYTIDPRIGSNEEYKDFVGRAHKKGLKVIQDMVFNHISEFHFLYEDMIDPKWFYTDERKIISNFKTYLPSDRNASAYDKDTLVKGAFSGYSPAVNGGNSEVQDYLIQNSLWWIESVGINGIRMDTYPYNDFDEMVRWCKAVDEEHPGFNIVGETFMKSPIAISFWQQDSPVGDKNTHLPTVMDFPLCELLKHVCDEETSDWSWGLSLIQEYLADERIYAHPDHLLTFMANHDMNRFTTSWEQGSNNVRYKQALTLLLTLRGIPQLYYGDEVCMVGCKDESDYYQRMNFPGGFQGDHVNVFREENMMSQMWEYYKFTRRMLHWRKRADINSIIAEGRFIQHTICNGIYVYARILDDKVVTVMLNGTWDTRTVNGEQYADVMPKSYARDFLSGRLVATRKDITMGPRDIFIFDWT